MPNHVNDSLSVLFLNKLGLIRLQLNGFKNSRWFNSSIWPRGWTLTGTTAPGQSGPGNNGNEEYSKFPKAPRPEPYY